MSMHVRIKRASATIFLHSEKSDKFSTIRSKCGELMQMDPKDIGLFGDVEKTREFHDLATLGDHEIENDDIIYMVYKKGDSYEEVHIDDFIKESNGHDEEAEVKNEGNPRS